MQAKKAKRGQLLARRQKSYDKAYARDSGLCVFCYFLDRKRVKSQDVHHVYGRGKGKESWREHYTVMLCTCRKCHPPAIHGGPGTTFSLRYVERVMIQANENPINRHFSHGQRK